MSSGHSGFDIVAAYATPDARLFRRINVRTKSKTVA